MQRWGTGGVHRALSWETLRAALRQQVERVVDKTGQVHWRGQRWIVPEGLLQVKGQLCFTQDTADVWFEDTYYGPAVRADQQDPVRPDRHAPPAAPTAGPGISYLEVLAAQQAQRRAHGIVYHLPSPAGKEPSSS